MSMTTHPRPGLSLMAVLLLAAFAGGCAGGDEQERIDVTPQVDLPDSVALGEPLDIGYAWQPGEDFKPPANDYKVFVHLVDPQGQILLQDDHYPPEPTSQWRADRTEQYRRWVYPDDLDAEFVDVIVGLYTNNQRALVRSDGSWVDSVKTHRLYIRADDMTGVPVYMDGWHGEEQSDEAGTVRWRWSEGTARAVFTNPHKAAVLHLRAHGPFDEVGGPQTVTLRIGDQQLAQFQVDSAEPFLRRFEVPAEMMGDTDWLELTIQTDPVLVPSERDPNSNDDRQLGLQVFMLYLSSS